MAKKKKAIQLIRPESDFNPGAPEIGFYNLSEKVYRAAPGANWSTIKEMQKSAKSYKHVLDHGTEDTEDKKKGRLYHTLLLEPHLLDERWTPKPDTYPAKGKKKDDPPTDKAWNMNAHFCRDWVTDMETKGLEVVSKGDIVFGKRMVAELHALADARKILEGAHGYEVSCFWFDDETGLLCKCKLDILKNGQIGDFKKTQKGHGLKDHWLQWCSHIRGWRYHGQAAFYRDGVNAVYKHNRWKLPERPSFTWLIVEDSPPFDTAIYTIIDCQDAASYRYFKWGRELYRWLLSDVKMWTEKGVYPSYNVGPSLQTESMELEVPDFLNLEIV